MPPVRRRLAAGGPTSHTNPFETLDRALTPVLEAARIHAGDVDRAASFPSAVIEALRAHGFFGLLSAADMGGWGLGPRAAVHVVESIARICPSAAMVTCMHYAGAAVIEAHGHSATRREIAAGGHLSTLAFSEAGSRSQFWAPTSTATPKGDSVQLDARKSWVTSARHATAYVWSSRPSGAEGLSSLWLVPRGAPGLGPGPAFDGIGLRGNDSSPVAAEGVFVPANARLGEDGKGFDIMMGVVLPLFSMMIAAVSTGIMEHSVESTAEHARRTRFENTGESLADLPTLRAKVARMRIATDAARALLDTAGDAVEAKSADAMLRVLIAKAACADAAIEVTDLAMRVCGGAAFRKEVDVERFFRDARAAAIMAPTSDQLHDFIGRAVCGLPLF